MKFCFVILHYKTHEDTIKCVESIQQINGEKAIVIVDNASNNGSIEIIENRFNSFQNIYILKNQYNLGFADGNNVGYKYAREELKADFVAITNNDIIVETKDFINIIITEYTKSPFHIVGPDIVSLVDGGHQSPMIKEQRSALGVRKEIIRYRALYMLSKMGLYDLLKRENKERFKSVIHKQPLKETNVQLHGAFVIFSPDFVRLEETSFRSGTFLYMEEAILYHYCISNNYSTLFLPDIVVRHKEDSSTSVLFSATKQKREFVFKNLIKSLRVYLKYLTQ